MRVVSILLFVCFTGQEAHDPLPAALSFLLEGCQALDQPGVHVFSGLTVR